MKKSKAITLLLSLFVLLAVIIVPGNSQDQKKPVKVPGYKRTASDGMEECWCPAFLWANCRCVWYDSTGGGPDSPVNPYPEPEN